MRPLGMPLDRDQLGPQEFLERDTSRSFQPLAFQEIPSELCRSRPVYHICIDNCIINMGLGSHLPVAASLRGLCRGLAVRRAPAILGRARRPRSGLAR